VGVKWGRGHAGVWGNDSALGKEREDHVEARVDPGNGNLNWAEICKVRGTKGGIENQWVEIRESHRLDVLPSAGEEAVIERAPWKEGGLKASRTNRELVIPRGGLNGVAVPP